jgi:hypothetical protein
MHTRSHGKRYPNQRLLRATKKRTKRTKRQRRTRGKKYGAESWVDDIKSWWKRMTKSKPTPPKELTPEEKAAMAAKELQHKIKESIKTIKTNTNNAYDAKLETLENISGNLPLSGLKTLKSALEKIAILPPLAIQMGAKIAIDKAISAAQSVMAVEE